MTTTLRNTLRRLVEILTPIRRIDASIAWGVGIITLSILAWIAALVVMGDMDQGPGTSLHDFPTFLIGWVIMLTAMMLPSEILYVKVYAALLEDSIEKQPGPVGRFTCVTYFIAGYGIALAINWPFPLPPAYGPWAYGLLFLPNLRLYCRLHYGSTNRVRTLVVPESCRHPEADIRRLKGSVR